MAPSPRISILENWAMRARRDLHTRTFSRLARLDSFLPVSVFKFPCPHPGLWSCPSSISPDARQVYPAYERAMLREVERILKAIPHHDLAIQRDVCLEMLSWDGRGRPARLFLEWSRSSPPTSRDSPPRCPVAWSWAFICATVSSTPGTSFIR